MGAVALGRALFFVGVEAPRATAPDPLTGNLLATLSGVCWALTVVGLRWLEGRPAGGGSALPTVVAGNAIAFLGLLPLALPAAGAGATDWLILGYLGVFQIGLAYVLLAAAIRHVPALEASTLLLIEPALNPIWVWLVQDEVPGAWALTGGAMILGAILLKTWWGTRPPIRARRGMELKKPEGKVFAS